MTAVDELRQAAVTLRERASAATPGPWEFGDRWHVQASEFCPCRPSWGPAIVGKRDINGQRRDSHVHRLSEADAWMHGIHAVSDGRGGPGPIIVNTSEYGYTSEEDARYIAMMNPVLGLALADLLDWHVSYWAIGQFGGDPEPCETPCTHGDCEETRRVLPLARLVNEAELEVQSRARIEATNRAGRAEAECDRLAEVLAEVQRERDEARAALAASLIRELDHAMKHVDGEVSL